MNQNNPPNDPVDKPLHVPPKGHQAHGEALVDEAVAETLPASDPISPYSAQQSRPVALPGADDARRGQQPVESAPPWNGWTQGERPAAGGAREQGSEHAGSDRADED
jgi:hypothetical protein